MKRDKYSINQFVASEAVSTTDKGLLDGNVDWVPYQLNITLLI